MPAKLILSALAIVALPAPSLAVGLGPLSASGLTASPAKAFYLTLINPGPGGDVYRASAIGFDDETPVPNVQILPAVVPIGAGTTSRVLVIVRGLTPGQTTRFRVCAEGRTIPGETIHARVCSKLTARRVAAAR